MNMPAPHPTRFRFCPECAADLDWAPAQEDGGITFRWRCTQCAFTLWNNPTPVLAAIVEQDGQVLLARNAAWSGRMFALITGFMEAGESPEAGVAREVREETSLEVLEAHLVGVHAFERMNQVIITYHVKTRGEVALSPELVESKWMAPEAIKCWPQGTGLALADWLRSRGIEPQWMERPSA
jgi:NADH pyrophosphatase NudC (nudix superfamily)